MIIFTEVAAGVAMGIHKISSAYDDLWPDERAPAMRVFDFFFIPSYYILRNASTSDWSETVFYSFRTFYYYITVEIKQKRLIGKRPFAQDREPVIGWDIIID